MKFLLAALLAQFIRGLGFTALPSGNDTALSIPIAIDAGLGEIARFWAGNGTDCSNCIRVCPFNKPAGRFHDLVRLGIKHFKPLHRTFLWGDDKMGYGKRLKAEQFWK